MEQQSAKVFDTKINYYTHGQGQSLLFIHGHRSDALRWKGIILFLGKKFKVYAPDLPGFGQSPEFKNQPNTMSSYAKYMNEFIKKLNLKNYILFGGSMGGIIALKMLIQKLKTPPAKLVLAGTPYDKKYWTISFLNKLFFFLGKNSKFFIPLAEKIINNDFLLYYLLYFAFPKEARKKEIIKYEIKQWRVMSAKVWLETMIDTVEVNFSQEKFQTKIPTIILNAKSDQYFDAQKTTKGLKKLCPNNKVILLNLKSHVPKGELKLKHLKEFQSLLDLT